MNLAILNKDVQAFINKNLNSDITKLILKGSPFNDVSIQEIANQIITKNKCKNKLPSWFSVDYIYYPNKINLEQSSSEKTAKYKANLIKGNSLIDLTGGFGVDSSAFSIYFNHVIYCELNTYLYNIACYNSKIFGLTNIQFNNVNGLEYLQKSKTKIDLIYADPSRRDDTKNRVFLLKDSAPNIPDNLTLLFGHSNKILLKLSPFLDLTSTIIELKFVKEIHVVAVQNEIKELLFYLEKDHDGNIHIKTINFNNLENQVFNVNFKSEAVSTFSLPLKYLYEPNNAILKAGLFNDVSHQLKLYKLQNNSHLYTSSKLVSFPGRVFQIMQILNYDKKKLLDVLPLKKANITVRNFPDSVKQIRQKTGIKEGGTDYLFFTTNMNGKYIVIFCKKV